jgi:small subunit ribosomal protein S1
MSENDEDFAAMLAEFEKDAPKRRDPKVGETVKARIVSIGAETVFLDVGAKSEGVLDLAEVRDAEGHITVSVGDVIEARVVESGGGGVVLRRQAIGRGPQAQEELQQAFELHLPVEGVVTGVNKGGVEVTVAGSRGFCPISQLELRHVEDAAAYVGERLQFYITRYELGRREANLVLSRRALLEEEAHKRAAAVRERLSVGAVLRGTVSTIKDYGAFIDLGGLEGMLHVSELGFQRVSHPKDVLAPGQTIEVQVIRIEKGDDPKKPVGATERSEDASSASGFAGRGRPQLKISLSLKALAADPWDGVQLVEGTKLVGKVGRVESFGAFVEVAPGIEGLLPLRQIAGGRKVGHARQIIKPGTDVEVIIQDVDREKRRIALSLAGAQVEDDDAAPPPPPAEKQSFGTFADLLSGGKKDKGKGKK